MLTISAYAKINLGLEILRRRPDGYHDVVTILQEIDLADTLTFTDSDSVSLMSTDPTLESDGNLALRAARLLKSVTGCQLGVSIRLEKHIPVAAGLGGGSSDAAATLVALNRFWGLGRSVDELRQLAGQLGSDVPFFVRGGTQLATGRGDELQPVPTPRLYVVIVPGTEVVQDKTRRLYAALRPEDFSTGRDVYNLAASLRDGATMVSDKLPNAFERVARSLFQSVSPTLTAFEQADALPSLGGAGPSVFSLHHSTEEARRVADFVAARGYRALVVAALPSDVFRCQP